MSGDTKVKVICRGQGQILWTNTGCFHLDVVLLFNSLPNDKILTLTKFKAFADDKIMVNQKLKLLEKVENIVGKGENAGYQHFLLFPQCFLKLSFPEVLKVGIVW